MKNIDLIASRLSGKFTTLVTPPPDGREFSPNFMATSTFSRHSPVTFIPLSVDCTYIRPFTTYAALSPHDGGPFTPGRLPRSKGLGVSAPALPSVEIRNVSSAKRSEVKVI